MNSKTSFFKACKIKRSCLLATVILLLCFGCGKDGPAPVKLVELTAIQVESEQLVLKLGEKLIINYTLVPENASNRDVIITAADSTIIAVNGVEISALKTGKTEIVISNGAKTVSTKINIEVFPIDASGLILNKKLVALFVGERDTLTGEVNPPNATDKVILWKSENATIASISKEGHVLAVKEGITRFFASIQNSRLADTVEVIVKPIVLTKITLNKETLALKIGELETLIATASPSNSSNLKLTWRSGDDAVATVDQKGNVKAVGVGSTAIEVTSADGKVTAKSSLTVSPIKVVSIALDQSDLVLAIGSIVKIRATVNPANATAKDINWTSSDPAVIMIDNGTAKAMKKGIATITVTAESGEVGSSIAIEVKDDYELISGGLSFSMSSVPGRLMIGMTPQINNASNKALSIKKVECYVDGTLAATDLEGFKPTIDGKAEKVNIVTFTQTQYTSIVKDFPPNWHAKVYFVLNNTNYRLTIMKSGSTMQPLQGISIGINPSWDGDSKVDF